MTGLKLIKGLIFDFDGLILDTEMPVYRAWCNIFEQHGCVLSFDKWSANIGTDFEAFNPFQELENLNHSPIDRADISVQLHQLSAEFMQEQTVLPGVREIVFQAHQAGLRTAIASSSDFNWVEENLRRHGLFDQFDCIRTAENVERVKPYPDLFLSAVNCLGLTPDEVIVFEDSLNGVRAAKAAGIFCVAVPNPLTAKTNLDHADLRINTLDEVSLDQLIAYATSSKHA